MSAKEKGFEGDSAILIPDVIYYINDIRDCSVLIVNTHATIDIYISERNNKGFPLEPGESVVLHCTENSSIPLIATGGTDISFKYLVIPGAKSEIGYEE